MVPALLHGNIILLYTSAALMGAGSGGAYIVAVAVLQSWVPESIGSITACGMVFAQFGSLGGTAAFRLASSFFGNPHTAMFVTSVLSGMLVASCTLLLSRPMHDWDPREEKCAAMMSDVSDATPLLFDAKCSDSEDSVNDASQSENTDKSSSQMSIFEVLRSWMFYPYMVMIAVELAPATGLMLVFPQMLNILFHIPLERANKIFLWVHVGGVCGRLIGGVAVDIIAHVIPDSTGLASTKIVNGAVLTLQSTMLVAMVVAVGQGNVVVFTIAAGFVYFCFCAGMVGSACHARSMYTGRNSTLVFALSGLLTGIATLLFSNMLAAASGTQMSPSSRANAHKIFMDFFTLSIKVSLVGLVCCLCTTVCKKAYDKANGQNSDLLRAEAC